MGAGRRFLRPAAAALLVVAAGAAVALACCGADGALDVMKYYWATGVVMALAALSALALAVPPPGRAGWVSSAAASRLLHLGLALVLAGWAYNQLAGPDDGSLRLRAGQRGRVADAGELALEDFSILRWADTGTVRQYVSRVQAVSYAAAEAGGVPAEAPASISVNHPHVFRAGVFDPGWWVYQSSYEELVNPHTGRPLLFTILLCVRDVGLYWAALGGLLLVAGALLLAWSGRAPEGVAAACWPKPLAAFYALAFAGAAAMLVHRGASTGHAPLQNMYEFLICAAALLPVLTWLSRREERPVRALLVDAALQALVLVPVAFFMDGRVKHLMPALQSPFFVPHVGAYVLGYLLLVRAAFGVGRRLVGAGFLLLTVGLVLGAAWGKVCWGHWWQFDPKEMWSLATWLVYAAYFHVRPRLSERGERVFLASGAVLIVLTLTWINLSRIFTGMHSYA